MIILPQSFKEIEIKNSPFSFSDVKKGLFKVSKGLGISLRIPGMGKVQFKKISLISKNGHARMLTIIQSENGLIIPILLRSKKDKVSENMSHQNKHFTEAFFQMHQKIYDDIARDDFEIITE